MRLKSILLEGEVSKWVNKLEGELESGEWVVREPFLYRGRDEDKRPVMKKETTGGREPLDTDLIVHNIVNFYHDYCYEQFPSRDEVRFATTDEYWALEFGDPHVIFPHKNSTVYQSTHDPVHEFGSASDGLNDFYSRLRRWYRSTDGEFPNQDVKNIAYHFKEMVENGEVEEEYLKENPCIDDMKDKLRSIDNAIEIPPDYDWISSLIKFYANISAYFQEMSLGYPETEISSDEVVIKGKYLQVQKNVFDEYQKRK